MHTASNIGGKNILSVYLPEARKNGALTHSDENINTALKKEPILGVPSADGQIRWFNRPGNTNVTIHSGGHFTRKRVTAFFIEKMNKDLQRELLEGINTSQP